MEHKTLENLQAQGVIHPSTSPWSSLIVLAQKKSGQVWPCVDYQQLNKVTKDVAYPIPRTQDCLDAMTGVTMFSAMDTTLAYNQVPVAEKDIPKTAFQQLLRHMSTSWSLHYLAFSGYYV